MNMKEQFIPWLQNQDILLQVLFLGLLLVNFHHPYKLLIVTWNRLIMVRATQLEIAIQKELIITTFDLNSSSSQALQKW